MGKRIDVPRRFEAELRKRGVVFARTADGQYEIEQADHTSVVVSLDNLQRDVTRDQDATAIPIFVDRVVERADVVTWAQARRFVRFSAEPNDFDFQDTIRTSVSRQVERVLTVTDRDETRVRWVTPAMLKAWKVSRREAEKAAGENLDRLLRGKRLKVESIGGMRLGMVPIGLRLQGVGDLRAEAEGLRRARSRLAGARRHAVQRLHLPVSEHRLRARRPLGGRGAS